MHRLPDIGRRWSRRIRHGLAYAVAVMGEGWILRASGSGDLVEADCIIVPGTTVGADGEPSDLLRARVLHAVGLLQRGLSAHIVLTGGPRPGLPAEADVAHALARSAGVATSRLHREVRSRNTIENFVMARDLMASHGWRSCLISTEPSHARRCLHIARALGLRARAAPAFDSPGFTNRRLRRWLVAHECGALLRMALDGRLRRAAARPPEGARGADA